MPAQGEPDGYGYLTPDTFTPTDYICGRLRIPNNQLFLSAVMGALADLTKAHSWEPFGTMTPDDTAYLALEMYDDFVMSRGFCMIGMIIPFVTESTPTNTLYCNGAEYLRADYPDLYAAISTIYHIDADHFVVPDLRGYVPVGVGDIPGGATVGLGQIVGDGQHLIDVTEMPSHSHTNSPHTHTLTPHTHTDVPAVPNITTIGPGAPEPTAIPGIGTTGLASDGISTDSITIDSTGGSTPMSIVQPSYGLHFCVVAR